jgi:RNA polymerase sigma-70 factor (ECF subfamily)
MTPAPSVSSFPSSHWSLIARAGNADRVQAQQALADLCQRYWYPLYAFVRRKVNSVHEAEDVTQGFFAHLIKSELVTRADPERGRFRTFLLACCKNYLKNHWRKKQKERPPDGVVVVSIDYVLAATRYSQEPADPSDPEALYLRRFALTLLDETFEALEEQSRADGRWELFVRLRPTLTKDSDAQSYAVIADEVRMTEAAVKKAAQRLRERFGEVLRGRIADTVEEGTNIEGEIRDLIAAVH